MIKTYEESLREKEGMFSGKNLADFLKVVEAYDRFLDVLLADYETRRQAGIRTDIPKDIFKFTFPYDVDRGVVKALEDLNFHWSPAFEESKTTFLWSIYSCGGEVLDPEKFDNIVFGTNRD